MLLKQGSRKITDLFIATIISALLSQFSLTFLFFTIPLYTLYHYKGVENLLIGTAIVVGLLLIFSLLKTRSVANADLRMAYIIVEMIVPIILLLGMFFVIDIFPVISELRRLYRLFIATLVAVIIVLPISKLLMNNEVFIETIENQFNAFVGALLNNQRSNFEGEVLKSFFGIKDYALYIKDFYSKTVAAIYFVLLLSVSRLSDVILSRKGKIKLLKLENFKVPETLLMPVLVAALGMLVKVFDLFSLGVFAAVIWNCGLILLFLYGVQGLAITRVLFARLKLSYSIRFMFEFLILMLLFIPGINFIVIIGLPVFGISETWINLRKTIRSTDREDYT